LILPDNSNPPIIKNLLSWAENKLAQSSSSAGVDARVLLQFVTGDSLAKLISNDQGVLTENKAKIFRELVIKRHQGLPVAYLTGTREFWSLPLEVTPATLIPRPETELLVEKSLYFIPKELAVSVADIGTGSGAIVFAIAHERPMVSLVATDNSKKALAVAKRNRERLGYNHINFRYGNLLEPLNNNSYELIASNPPYIREDDPHLTEGDVAFEPSSALVSGPDGLDAIRKIAKEAPQKLVSGGRLLIEHGFDQARDVQAIFQQEGFADIETYQDLSGHERVTQGRII